MDLTGLLTSCHNAVGQQKQLYRISSLSSRLPAVLVLSLCGCMLWQCSTCLIKYLSSPIGASVAFSQDLSLFPIALTICNKDTELEYKFPELSSVESRKGKDTNWQTVWTASSGSVTVDTFLTNIHQNQLRLCKTIHVHEKLPSELRLRHYYSTSRTCNLKKMEVYLHNPGLVLASDFSVLLPKKMFDNDENIVLELNLDTMISLPTPEFNCSQEEEGQTLDSCILAEAVRAANKPAGCISKYLR